MTVRMDLSALVDDWSANRVAPGERKDGWPFFYGCIYGDLTWEARNRQCAAPQASA